MVHTDEDSASMKRTNLFGLRLKSMREKVQSIWKLCSVNYAAFLFRSPWILLGVSSLLTLALTGCFLGFMRIRSFDQTDFVMNDGESMRNARRLQQLFGNDAVFRAHQQLHLYPTLDIIMKRKADGHGDSTNMLDERILDEIHFLDKLIHSIQIRSNATYSSLCTRIDHACVIDGNYLLTDAFRQALKNLHPPKHGYFFDSSGANGIPAFMFGKHFQLINETPAVLDYEGEPEEKTDGDAQIDTIIEPVEEPPVAQIISNVSVFRLRYSLNTSTDERRQLAIEWEREVFRYLNEEYQSTLIDLFVSTSTAITDSVEKKAHEEGILMSMMLLIFFVLFCIFSSIQGNLLTSLGLLPLFGIIGIALSTGATFGLLSLCRVQIIEPLAFLVFLVAILEAMRCSIVCGEYHRVIDECLSSKINPESILSSIIESTHPYFLVSTLTLCCVYFLLILMSPMASTMLISSTFMLCIVINYLVHATFFSSCLVITLKRVSSRRHCFSCHRLPTTYEIPIKTSPSVFARFNIDSIYRTFLAGTLCLLSIVAVVFSLWLALSIDTRLFDDEFLPRDIRILRSHMKSQLEDFDLGPVVLFTVPQLVDYEQREINASIVSLLRQCRSEPRTNAFQMLWLEQENITLITHSNASMDMRINPASRNDIAVSQGKDRSTIVASRFYCQLNSIQGDREDIRTMNNLYAYARQSSLPGVFPYSVVFPNYESLAQIRLEMYLLLILLVTCALVITYLFFLSWKISLSIAFDILFLYTGTLACLYQIHRLTFNFANALWLPVVPVLFLETLIHSAYFSGQSKWKYNRIILSLLISLSVLYIYPIQSYVFLLIRNSLLYQSVICLLLINVLLPSLHHLSRRVSGNEPSETPIQLTATMPEGKQALTSGNELLKELVPGSNVVANSAI